jgi:hypothetical protein
MHVQPLSSAGSIASAEDLLGEVPLAAESAGRD